jgi:hypothetical protein
MNLPGEVRNWLLVSVETDCTKGPPGLFLLQERVGQTLKGEIE